MAVRRGARLAAQHPFALLVGVAVLLAGLLNAGLGREERIGVPVPLLVYEIEAVSGNHRASLLNLGIAPLGVVPVPTPIDIDGDLLPDVTVTLNLIDAAGLFEYPPDVDRILAPNLQIDRLLPGLPLTTAGPPLRINAKITVLDVGGTSPPLQLRLGYDTGPGGAIPPKFKLVADGLTSFFNPVRARVEAPGYEGPLSVIAGMEQGGRRADADLRFLPLPKGLQFSYGSDADGQHIGVNHAGAVGTGADAEVDLQAAVRVTEGSDRSTIDARVDRLPRNVDVGVLPGGADGGGFEYTASGGGGRAPDIRLDVASRPGGGEPLLARLDLEALPSQLNAAWSLPDEGPTEVHLETPQDPIGAVQARVANFDGAPNALPAYLPSAPQHLDLRQSADGKQRLVTGRVQGVRLVDLVEGERGLDAHVQAGGGAALEVNASLGAVGEEERQVDARSTVDPLPTDLTAIVRDAGEDQAAEPLEITYRSSSEVDVTGHVEVRNEGLPRSAPCGVAGTICADLALTDLPSTIETKVAQVSDDDGDDARVTIHAEPRPGSPAPSITAGVVTADESGSVLVADLAVTDLPEDMGVRLVRAAGGSLQRAEFQACELAVADPTGGCVAGTESSIGSLAVDVRSYLDGQRPAGLAPVVLDRPEHVVVVGAGADDGMAFQAKGRFTDIEEVRYVAEPTTGLRVRAGAEKELLAEIHLADIDPAPDDDEDSGQVFDLDATLAVPSLPPSLDICIRPEGAAPAATEDALTAPCDDRTPFGDDVDVEGNVPLSFGYLAGAPFDVEGSVHRREQGRTSLTADDAVDDDTTVDAGLDVIGLPENLVFHLLQPTTPDPDDVNDVAGPLRARFEASDSPTRIDFSGSQRIGDAVCKDRRPGAEATCLSGTLEELPTLLDLFVDPAAEPVGAAEIGGDGNSLTLHTVGGDEARLTNLDLSTVTPVADADPAASDVLLLTGSLTGIPEDVAGKLRAPRADIPDDEPDLEILAEPSLGTLDVELRTSLDPDTFDAVPPAHLQLPAPFGQEIILQAQGEDVKARVHTTDVTRVAYRAVRDAEDRPLPTKVIALEFDGAQTARLYADLQKEADGGVERLTADVVAPHLPSGLEVCFRGEQPASTPDPAEGGGTWCDTVADDQGAVQVVGTDGSDPTTSVDAYVRNESNGGSELVAARLGATGVPPVLRATLPGGEDSGVDIVGLDTDATSSRAIGLLEVEAALGGDLAGSGWTAAESPFRDRPLPTSANGYTTPFPLLDPGGQHVSIGQDGDLLHLRARLGPGSQLQQLRMTNAPCAAPANQPPDYPHYPLDDDTIDYRCVGARFSPSAGGGPLALFIAKGTGPGEILRLHDAGLSNVPESFQMTLADAPTTKGDDDELRPRCGPAGATSQPDDCLPPLIRFDQPSATSELFGILEQGDPLTSFVSSIYDPTCDDGSVTCAPDFDAVPPSNDRGIRVKVLDIKAHPALPSASALKASLRLAVPQSLTIEAPQTWAFESEGGAGATSESAKDIRFAYAVRNAAGAPVENLGRFAAFVNDGGQEMLITDPDGSGRGIVLPGELDLGLYLRDTSVQGRKFLQVDGRTTSVLNAQLQLFDGNLRPSDLGDSVYTDVAGLEWTTLRLMNAPKAEPGDPRDEPSFRIRFEMLKPPGDAGTSSVEGPPSALQLIGLLTATLDFAPDSTPARRIEGVMSIDGPLVGLEVVAFDDVDKAPLHQDNPPDTTRRPAQFSMDGDLEFDALNYQLDDFDSDTYIHIRSRLNVKLKADNAERFMLRNNVASFNATVSGPNSTALVGPITWNIFDFNVEVDTGYWIQAEIEYDGSSAPVNAHFSTCRNGSYVANHPNRMTEGIPLANSTFNGSVDLLDDGRFSANVVGLPDFILLPVVDFLFDVDARTAARDATCNLQPGDYELIHHEDPFGTVFHPGDPLAVPGHDVPPVNPAHLTVPPAGVDRVAPGSSTAPLPVDAEITDQVALCGIHAFEDLVINPLVQVKVASVADETPVPYGDGRRPRCPAGSEGTLRIVAQTVTVNGFLDANAVMSQAPEPVVQHRGHGGGGHGGNGGHAGCDDEVSACNGLGHAPYAFFPPQSPLTEPGMPGSAGFDEPYPPGGFGGGHIVIAASEITNNGFIMADGAAGQNVCPTDDIRNGGGGGGSGGGISLTASTVNNNGTISARGGNGGDGHFGGGGGGGGIVKIHTPELNGEPPAAIGGLAGDECGSGRNGTGGIATNLAPYIKARPADRITSVSNGGTPSPLGWVGDLQNPRFGYSVKLPADPPTGGTITVAFLCLVPRDEITLDFQMPNPGGEDEEACGADSARGGVVLTAREQSASAVAGIPLGVRPNGIPITDDALSNGIWGAWTHVCNVSYDDDEVDGFNCNDDPIPAQPDFVFGADAENPELVLDAPGLPFRDRGTFGRWWYAKGEPTGGLRFPGLPGYLRRTTVWTTTEVSPAFASTDAPVTRALCLGMPQGSNPFDEPDSAFSPCAIGPSSRYLRDGPNWVAARVFLANGGRVEKAIPIVVDAVIPKATAVVTARPPSGLAGWHRTTPTVAFGIAEGRSSADDFADESGFGGEVLAYSIDGGPERTIELADCPGFAPSGYRYNCPVPQAEIDQLGPGTHRIRFTAIDLVGNRRHALSKQQAVLNPDLDMYSVVFQIDADRPAAELTTVPAAPDGFADWFTSAPVLVLRDKDRLGGSGIGGRSLVINGVTEAYTGPVRLTGEGSFDHCAGVIDVAGNNADAGCGMSKVDLVDPVVTVAAPPAPASGWHQAPVLVTIMSLDAMSGVPGFVPGGTAADCALLPPPATPAGRCASIDGGPYLPSDGTEVLGEGEHVVRAFATDRAGRRSPVDELTVRVDVTAPTTIARLVPPLPARGSWWRRVPLLDLRATDATSSVARIEYRIDGGAWTTYAEPVSLPVGVHTVRSRATDGAGHLGPETVSSFAVDAGAPAPKALSPAPPVWVRVLGPANASLTWNVADNQTGPVRVFVIVYDATGVPIRRLDGGTVQVVAGGSPVARATLWDGKNSNGGTPLIGLFHYRVVAIDAAGNRAQSSESRPIQLAL